MKLIHIVAAIIPLFIFGCTNGNYTTKSSNKYISGNSGVIDCNYPKGGYEKEFCRQAEQQEAKQEAWDDYYGSR